MCVYYATCAQEQPNPLSVRGGVYRRPPGFQVDLVCLSSWMDGEAPGSITALSVNSAYGLYIIHYFLARFYYVEFMSAKIELSYDSIMTTLCRMAYGNDGGLVLIDIIQKSVLLSMASVDLYSSADPYTRLPRSPKRPTDSANSRAADLDDNSVRSPSCDQVKCGNRVKDKQIRKDSLAGLCILDYEMEANRERVAVFCFCFCFLFLPGGGGLDRVQK